jgi:glycosidase
MRTFLNGLLLGCCFLLFACNSNTSTVASTSSVDTATVDGHPAWIEQGNIYEVNVRQYTPEGTFKAFEKHLDRLKDMGIQTLWFMPVNPIGKKDRKGALGSYYAVSNYTAIDPEYGTMDDWKALVKDAHAKDLR